MYIDSHCHFNSLTPFQAQSVADSCKSGYVLIDSSIDAASSAKSIELSNQYPFIYSALGFHPFSWEQFRPDTISVYQEFIRSTAKVIAIGEIGLDTQAGPPDKQEDILKEFIKLAIKNDLPIVIHNRTIDMRIFDILDEFFENYERVVFHCFSYGLAALDKIIAKKGLASFSLNVLRKKEDLLASLEKCPPGNLLLETDSPYMKINHEPSLPLDIRRVYNRAAEIKNMPLGQLDEAVSLNAARVFKIKI